MDDIHGGITAEAFRKFMIKICCIVMSGGGFIFIIDILCPKYKDAAAIISLSVLLILGGYFYRGYAYNRNLIYQRYIEVMKSNLSSIENILGGEVYYDNYVTITRKELARLEEKIKPKRRLFALKNYLLHGKYKNVSYKIFTMSETSYPLDSADVKVDDVEIKYGYTIILEDLFDSRSDIKKKLEPLNKKIFVETIELGKLRVIVLNEDIYEYDVKALYSEKIDDYINEDTQKVKEVLHAILGERS